PPLPAVVLRPANEAVAVTDDAIAGHDHAVSVLVAVALAAPLAGQRDQQAGAVAHRVFPRIAHQVADGATAGYAERLAVVVLIGRDPSVRAPRVEQRLQGLVCAVDSVCRSHAPNTNDSRINSNHYHPKIDM